MYLTINTKTQIETASLKTKNTRLKMYRQAVYSFYMSPVVPVQGQIKCYITQKIDVFFAKCQKCWFKMQSTIKPFDRIETFEQIASMPENKNYCTQILIHHALWSPH